MSDQKNSERRWRQKAKEYWRRMGPASQAASVGGLLLVSALTLGSVAIMAQDVERPAGLKSGEVEPAPKPLISRPVEVSEERMMKAWKEAREAQFSPKPRSEQQLAVDKLKEARLAKNIAEYYKIAPAAARKFVAAAMGAGEQAKVDPLLVLAVVAVESHFNPVAQSNAGAIGLMQVIPKWHPKEAVYAGGEEGFLLGERNIIIGALALRKFIDMSRGNMEVALSRYNGSISDETRAYARLVLKKKAMFERWVRT